MLLDQHEGCKTPRDDSCNTAASFGYCVCLAPKCLRERRLGPLHPLLAGQALGAAQRGASRHAIVLLFFFQLPFVSNFFFFFSFNCLLSSLFSSSFPFHLLILFFSSFFSCNSLFSFFLYFFFFFFLVLFFFFRSVLCYRDLKFTKFHSDERFFFLSFLFFVLN